MERIFGTGGPRPNDTGQALHWAQQHDLIDLLEQQRGGGPVALYASISNGSRLFLHSALVPAAVVDALPPARLCDWDGGANDSWRCSLVTGGDRPPRVECSPPEVIVGGVPLTDALPLVVFRSFNGRLEHPSYFDVAQLLLHAHDLHWTPERLSWCRFDDNGDVEDPLRWMKPKGKVQDDDADCVVIDRELLEMHMAATNTVLLQFVDSTRTADGFAGWDDVEELELPSLDRSLRMHIEGDTASWLRGTQIVRPRRSATELGEHLVEQMRRPKNYATFLTQDWKNDRVEQVSCDPSALATYFDKDSPLPWETSPVFFSPAVLEKYKADPDKYALDARSIDCRNAWHLSSYGITNQGQVHTYIGYLGNLPHEEQLYWKSFNQEPKGPIAERVFKTDFEGRFDTEPEPLRDLLSRVRGLHDARAPWFVVGEPALLGQIHYPLTPSHKAWGDVLTSLTKLIVEPLQHRYFQGKARELGEVTDPQAGQWRSIRWLKETLHRMGLGEPEVAEIVAPFQETQGLRTQLDAHTGGAEATARRANLLKEHGSPRGHIESLCARLERSLARMTEIFGTQ